MTSGRRHQSGIGDDVRRLLIVALLAMGLVAAAPGENLDAARALYDRGAMLKAAELARGSDTAEGHALASQATLVAAIYQRPDHDDELLRRAADDARAALRLDPDHVQAHLQLALALGYLAEDDPLGAHLNGTAREGKELLDRALALAPDDAWTHGMLGVWHLRVVRHAGPMLAESMYGASLEEGLAQCEEAADLAPDLLPVRFGCAIGLLEADPRRHRQEALAILEMVVRLPARDAAAQLIQADARHRLDLLKAGAWEGFGADPAGGPPD
jgi:tetratricopeptide (TPR) repeat protein